MPLICSEDTSECAQFYDFTLRKNCECAHVNTAIFLSVPNFTTHNYLNWDFTIFKFSLTYLEVSRLPAGIVYCYCTVGFAG